MFNFSWNIAVIIVQSRLKLYDFTILAAGVEPNKSVILIRSAHNGVVMCLFDRTEDRIWTWTVNFYSVQKQDYCCKERRNSPSWFVKHKAQSADVLSSILLLLHGIRFVSEHLEPLRGTAENYCRPSFLLGSLFNKLTCLDCFLIFVLTGDKCVTVFIQCFCTILLCFILSCLDISKWKALSPDETYHSE